MWSCELNLTWDNNIAYSEENLFIDGRAEVNAILQDNNFSCFVDKRH